MAASSSSFPSSSSGAANTRDRAAVEQLMGRALPQEWPSAALPAGSRVVVVRDPGWDGPWRNEFLGTIDGMGAPEPVESPRARAGELAYWVTFDEPQYDGDGDGPYRKAFIWDRYLRPGP
ncbi:ferrous iron transport protein A [Streptomyces virginiae]|uniref:ferrous iron transport protein A n=1 Tax=Streptomyces virginiae TaxID=1961 RepID=UPI002257254C|nr:ferrous iron transport protein A [Streptomyces virginiae]MCX4956780.1 ferrous iron transport protein A [Streptomyces virginiae]MCX5175544.1 ferrous iron transport protein A [Streptomyces virginiae]